MLEKINLFHLTEWIIAGAVDMKMNESILAKFSLFYFCENN